MADWSPSMPPKYDEQFHIVSIQVLYKLLNTDDVAAAAAAAAAVVVVVEQLNKQETNVKEELPLQQLLLMLPSDRIEVGNNSK